MVSDPGLSDRSDTCLRAVVLCYLGCGFFFQGRRPLWLPMFFAGAALATVINVMIQLLVEKSVPHPAMGGLVALLFQNRSIALRTL